MSKYASGSSSVVENRNAEFLNSLNVEAKTEKVEAKTEKKKSNKKSKKKVS